jgi:AcrR family transcriptional regulator
MDVHQPQIAQEPRQKAILAAAFEVFRLYGFRRTSMEDIAQAAGMSRAAIYLHYRNKEDIFQSLVQFYFDTTCAEVTRILALDLPVPRALADAFAAQGGPIIEALLNSPHGAEFMDAKTVVSAELVRAGEARLVAIYTDWLNRETSAGRVSLAGFGHAANCAETLLAALNGMKSGVSDYASYAAAVARLAALFGRALAG